MAILGQYNVAPDIESQLLARLVSTYRKHLSHRGESTGAMEGRAGAAVRRVEDNILYALRDLGVSARRDIDGTRDLDRAYHALVHEAQRIVFVSGGLGNDPAN